MTLRTVVLLSLPLALSACANDRPGSVDLLPASPFATASLAATGIGARGDLPLPADMPKKTMSDKVLAAMALERVTGLKPDPARLVP